MKQAPEFLYRYRVRQCSLTSRPDGSAMALRFALTRRLCTEKRRLREGMLSARNWYNRMNAPHSRCSGVEASSTSTSLANTRLNSRPLRCCKVSLTVRCMAREDTLLRTYVVILHNPIRSDIKTAQPGPEQNERVKPFGDAPWRQAGEQ